MKIDLALEANRSKKSVNKDFYQPLNLEIDSMVIPSSDISSIVNTYKVFDDERNAATKYRLNLTLNPIMVNTLVNKITEVRPINSETYLTGQTRLNAIQKIDDKLYTYRVGYDIFDNNFTRFNTFKTGNTLNDFLGTTLSDLLNINKSIDNNIFDDNGWTCTINKTKINGNKMFPQREACEKIDLFPTRDYFSFKPIFVNNLLKDNWDFSLTYPYVNYTNNLLVESNTGINGIPITSSVIIEYNGSMYLQINTVYKHGLKADDVIKIKGSDSNSDKTYLIYDIGDVDGINQEYIFILDCNKYSNLLTISNISDNRIVKVINRIDSKYYIRKFRKLPNFTEETEPITEENIEGRIVSGNTFFDNDSYQPGFSRNIFNDSIYQIQYTDDIDINLIKDNLGRPLSEIYLTIIKKNIIDGNYEPENIFTKVTSGVDELPGNTGYTNVRLINGVTTNESPLETNITSTGGTLYDGFTPQKNVFLGDIVEYNASTAKEIKLDDIYHRFNTVQREKTDNKFIYSDIFGDSANILLNSTMMQYRWGFNPGEGTTDFITVPNKVILTNTMNNTGSTWFWCNDIVQNIVRDEDYYLSFDLLGTTSINLKIAYSIDLGTFNANSDTIPLRVKIPINIPSSAVLAYNVIYFIIGTYGVNCFHYSNQLCNFKLEKNTVSTPWSLNPNEYGGVYKFINKTLEISPSKEGYIYKPHYPIKLKNYSESISEGELSEIDNCYDFVSGITFTNQIILLEGQADYNVKSLILRVGNISGLTNFDMIRITKNINYEYINSDINISLNLKNCIIFPYDKNFMPGVSTITIDNYSIKKYSESTIPVYAQDQYDGRCIWRDLLKEGVIDSESTKVKESIYTNGGMYINESFNFYLKRQDPFGLYGLIANTFPYDLYGNDINDNTNTNNSWIQNNKIRRPNTLC